MITHALEYRKAHSVAEAIALLTQGGDGAQIVAGGQSLIPLMRLQLASPSVLVDINPISELKHVTVEDGFLRVGALVRYVEIERSDVVKKGLPLLAEVASVIGDPQIRSLGTIGGAVAHGDPAGDCCMLCVMLEAEIVTNRRRIPAGNFFVDPFTTAREADEVVSEIRFPLLSGSHRYIKLTRFAYDSGVPGVAVQSTDDGWRIGLTNMSPSQMRATAVEAALAAGAPPAEAVQAGWKELDSGYDSALPLEYRKQMARVLTKRALEQATASGSSA